MSEQCCWSLRARGSKDALSRFVKAMTNAESNAKGENHGHSSTTNDNDRREIAGSAYGTFPYTPGIYEAEPDVYAVCFRGASRESLEPMLTRDDENPTAMTLPEAAKEFSISIEVFADTIYGFTAIDYHLFIVPDGTILTNEEKAAMHEWRDSFDSDEELVSEARPVFKDMGMPLPDDTDEAMRIIAEYTDDEGYIDITPIKRDFSI